MLVLTFRWHPLPCMLQNDLQKQKVLRRWSFSLNWCIPPQKSGSRSLLNQRIWRRRWGIPELEVRYVREVDPYYRIAYIRNQRLSRLESARIFSPESACLLLPCRFIRDTARLKIWRLRADSPFRWGTIRGVAWLAGSAIIYRRKYFELSRLKAPWKTSDNDEKL